MHHRLTTLIEAVRRLLIGIWLLSASAGGYAQQFQLQSSVIAVGGGTSSGGSFVLSGTSGQPDAGLLAGGAFILEGGFWGGAYAVQSQGAPLLSITGAGANVVLSWPTGSSDFVLEVTPSLATPISWSTVTDAVTESNGQRVVTLPGTLGNRFFRLRKQ